MEISNFTKYFVYWKISLVMLLENIITSDVIGKYIMGRLTNIGKYSSWSLILEASLHKIYCVLVLLCTTSFYYSMTNHNFSYFLVKMKCAYSSNKVNATKMYINVIT